MNPIPFSWMLIGLLVAALGGGSAAWHVAAWKYDVEKERSVVAAQQAQARAESRADEISNVFSKKLDSIKVVNTTIQGKATHELETRIYTDCKLPDSGRLLLNSSVDAGNDALGFTRTMPADPPPRIEGRPTASDDGRSVPARSRFAEAVRGLRAEAAGDTAKRQARGKITKPAAAPDGE